MRHIKLFEHFLNEANVVQDLRSGGKRFSAMLFGNELVLVDNDARSDHESEIYRQIEDLDKSVYDADAHLVVDTAKKTMSAPRYSRTDFFDRQRDRRYRMDMSDYRKDQNVAKLVSELKKRGIVNDRFRLIDVNSEDTLEKEPGALYMYHGTTESAAGEIMRKGLRPMDTAALAKDEADRLKSKFRGNSSTIDKYTDKNVYLTPSVDMAKTYAWRQAEHNQDEPVVLRVRVPDEAKLYIDDDLLLKKLISRIAADRRKISKELKANTPDVESFRAYAKSDPVVRRVASDFSIDHYPGVFAKTPWSENYVRTPGDYEQGLVQANLMSVLNGGGITVRNVRLSYEDRDAVSEYYQKEMPEYFGWLEQKIIEHYPEVSKLVWQESAYGYEQAAAYRGTILPKFIDVVPVQYKLKKY